MEVAADVMKAHHKGDASKCGTKDQTQICQYCEKNYMDDVQSLLECKDEANFCYMCCENEFGSFFLKEKNKCLE